MLLSYDDIQTIAVIGLGYVGLPLAVALARGHDVVGYDRDAARVAELRCGNDRTREVPSEALRTNRLAITDSADDMQGANVFILTVPTPVDGGNTPDLSSVREACETVGRLLTPSAIVVLESTVYPGVTEDICGPLLEKTSGMVSGRDFFLGYSPERINPGDREHTIDRIPKVVAGQTEAVAAILADLYGRITQGGVFVARDIRTAEAAKVIENAQRDINIAFINEVTMIFNRLGLSVYDVLSAANTKWNFLDFRPGLVGGHCIGVDPFYLAHAAAAAGQDPAIILAGRRINDGMGGYIAERVHDELEAHGLAPSRLLVLGLTFKEDVPDLRNSKVVDLINGLRNRAHRVEVHDPHADPQEVRSLYGLDLVESLDAAEPYDAVVGVVPHRLYRSFPTEDLSRLVRDGGLVADIKGMWRALDLNERLHRWEL